MIMRFYKTNEGGVEFAGNSLVVLSGASAHVLFIHEGEKTGKRIRLEKNASLTVYSAYLKNADVKNHFYLSENCRLEILDVFAGKVSVMNSIPLENADCTLHLLAKGTMGENESASYSALAAIGKTAANANVGLEEHAYLLGRGAKVSLVPGLEISNNDVSARHASSIREIDDEQLFYVMSRGLSEAEARKEIVSGFLSREIGQIKRLFGYEVKL